MIISSTAQPISLAPFPLSASPGECVFDSLQLPPEKPVLVNAAVAADTFLRHLDAEIASFQKQTGHSFDSDLKLYGAKKDGMYVLSEKEVESVKDVIRSAIQLPKDYGLTLSYDKTGDACAGGVIRGFIIGKSKVEIDFEFDRNTGIVRYLRRPVEPSMGADVLEKAEIWKLTDKFADEIYNWKEPQTSKEYVSAEKRAEVLASFDAALGLKAGTLTNLRDRHVVRGDTYIEFFADDKVHSTFTQTTRSEPGRLIQEETLLRSDRPK